jgi:hypothetical protein
MNKSFASARVESLLAHYPFKQIWDYSIVCSIVYLLYRGLLRLDLTRSLGNSSPFKGHLQVPLCSVTVFCFSLRT